MEQKIEFNSHTVAILRNHPSGARVLGSGFLIGEGLIATTKHVTDGDDRNLYISFPSYIEGEYQDSRNLKMGALEVTIKEIDPIKDICILEFDGAVDVPYKLSGTDFVQVGEPTIAYGYPHADQDRRILTQHISNVGAKVLLESNGILSKHIVLNTQARPGQSGGPVFNTTGDIIGMLIGSFAPGGGGGISLGGVDPHTLHQTTHVISAEYIKEMI